MTFVTIADAIAYVESFALRPEDHHDLLPPTERQAARFPQMRDLLALLGNPHDIIPAAHITGTSGKGSTATILAAIAQAAGKRVGLYTNPHITRPQERVQIGGADIGDAEFIACADMVAAAVTQLSRQSPEFRPHIKEIYTALALLAFARAHVDVAVVEVGMGGRYDETNVVHPVVAVITNIGFDHKEFLGDSLAAITWHKAGIIKEGAPVVTGITQPELLAIVRAEAARSDAMVAVMGEDFAADDVVTDLVGTRFTYRDQGGMIPEIRSPLIGTHQAMNATLAIRAARQIMPTLADDAIRAGVAQAWLPGRFEVVARNPLIILDAAHNPDKVGALVTTLLRVVAGQRIWVVFGALSAKESATMLAALAPVQPYMLIATAPTVVGRITSPAEHIAGQAQALGMTTLIETEPERALDMVLSQAAPDDIVVITGSLFLVSQVRGRWRAVP